MNFNYYSFAEHLKTFLLKYILILISESAIWTDFTILYSYFSYLFLSVCVSHVLSIEEIGSLI